MKAAALALLLLAGACGGSAATTTDPRAFAAQEYAASARRALAGTRFEELGDTWLVDLLLHVCDDLASGAPPEESIAASLGEAPPGDPVDDSIVAVVIGEGVDTLCPAAARQAAGTAIQSFLELTEGAAAELGLEVEADRLVGAGTSLCLVLATGGDASDAVVAELEALFGVTGSSVAEISGSGLLSESEGLLAGSVLGAAVGFLCPDHRDAVDAYLLLLGDR